MRPLSSFSADFNSKMEEDGVGGFADAQRRLAMEVPNVGNNENARFFLQAASAGNISMMADMLKRKDVDVNVRTNEAFSRKETALHVASRNDQLEAVKFLVANGGDVNLRDIRGKHPLHVAVSSGNLRVTRYLIENGANTDLVDKYGRSPLHWAALNRHADIAKELLDRGAKTWYVESGNWQPIHESVKVGETKIAQLLIDRGSQVNNPEVSSSKVEPFSPLHIAARDCQVDCVRLLLKYGAKVNYLNAGRQSPLHEAAHSGSRTIVSALLQHGADPNIQNNLMRTPLHEACHKGQIGCAIPLLDAGCNINQGDFHNDTPLLHFLRHCNETLFQAFTEDLLTFCDILLQYGADPNTKGSENQTAFTLATSTMNQDLLAILREALEQPQSLKLLCKVRLRKQIGCRYEEIKMLNIPSDLKEFLLQNCTYYLDAIHLRDMR